MDKQVLFLVQQPKRKQERDMTHARERKYWFWEKKIMGERLRKVAKNRWNSIQDACDRSLPSLQKKATAQRLWSLTHLLAEIRWRQPTRREAGNDRQPPWR
jgi:hypothetical protein